MGLPAAATERSYTAVYELHRVEEQGHGRIQNCRSGRTGQTVGHSEESSINELRQNVASVAVLLPRQHFTEGSRRKALLPVSLHI